MLIQFMDRRRGRLVPWAASALILALAGTGYAQTAPRRVAVAVHAADLVPEIAAAVRVAAERQIAHREMTVAPLGDEAAATAQIVACATEDAICMRQVMSGRALDQLVFFAVQARPAPDGEQAASPDLSVTARLIDAHTGAQLQVDQRLCEGGCPIDSRLGTMVEEMTGELLRSDAPEEPAPVQDPGNPLATGSSSPAVPLEQAESRSLGVIKVIPLAAGVVAVGTGLVLIAIDGPRIEDGVRQPDERATGPAGWVSIGIGGALIATGVVLWWLDGQPTDRVLAPAAGPTGAGAWLFGAEGRF